MLLQISEIKKHNFGKLSYQPTNEKKGHRESNDLTFKDTKVNNLFYHQFIAFNFYDSSWYWAFKFSIWFFQNAYVYDWMETFYTIKNLNNKK